MIELFGLAFGLVELAAIAVFFILLVIGASFDRGGASSPKWYVVGLGALLIAAYSYHKVELQTALDVVTSMTFWKPVIVYVAVGLLYSVLEFVLAIRRSAREFKDRWNTYLNNVVAPYGRKGSNDEGEIVRDRTFREIYEDVLKRGPESADFNKANEIAKDFVRREECRRGSLIKLTLGSDKLTVEPSVNKAELAASIGVWTLLWPAYGVSLIMGDLVAEFFRAVADFLVRVSGQFVKRTFSDVFKA